MDDSKWGPVRLFSAKNSHPERNKERNSWMHYLYVFPDGVVQSAHNSTTQDKIEEIDIQLEFITLLIGQRERGSHVLAFSKFLVQYLYSAVKM